MAGGISGSASGETCTACFWNTQTSGQAAAVGVGSFSGSVTGKTTSQMMSGATFSGAGWSLPGTWNIVEGVSYPYLTSLYSIAPQIVSGFAGIAGGKHIVAVDNGVNLGTAGTGANGF